VIRNKIDLVVREKEMNDELELTKMKFEKIGGFYGKFSWNFKYEA